MIMFNLSREDLTKMWKKGEEGRAKKMEERLRILDEITKESEEGLPSHYHLNHLVRKAAIVRLIMPVDIGGIFAVFSDLVPRHRPSSGNIPWHFRRIFVIMLVIPDEIQQKSEILAMLGRLLAAIAGIVEGALITRGYASQAARTNKIQFYKDVPEKTEDTEMKAVAFILDSLRQRYFGIKGEITKLLTNYVNSNFAKETLVPAFYEGEQRIQSWLERLLAGIEEDTGDYPCFNPRCFNRIKDPLTFCSSCLVEIPKIIQKRGFVFADEAEFTDLDETDDPKFEGFDDRDNSEDDDHTDDNDYSLDYCHSSDQLSALARSNLIQNGATIPEEEFEDDTAKAIARMESLRARLAEFLEDRSIMETPTEESQQLSHQPDPKIMSKEVEEGIVPKLPSEAEQEV
ncbi:MAG: hypothetical protein ACE5OZ_01245 [Candidatus Heimdallarchaeota archaeon]